MCRQQAEFRRSIPTPDVADAASRYCDLVEVSSLVPDFWLGSFFLSIDKEQKPYKSDIFPLTIKASQIIKNPYSLNAIGIHHLITPPVYRVATTPNPASKSANACVAILIENVFIFFLFLRSLNCNHNLKQYKFIF